MLVSHLDESQTPQDGGTGTRTRGAERPEVLVNYNSIGLFIMNASKLFHSTSNKLFR